MPAGLALGIDTTGERCSVGLLDMSDGRLLAVREPDIGKGHAERLMAIAEDVLGEAGCAYRDLSRIAVAIGPGSFTGIRVGVSAARGWALALSCPVVGVDRLEMLAEPYLGGGLRVLAVIDARRGELYVALHAADGTRLREASAVRPEELHAYVEAGSDLILTGSGAAIAAGPLADAGIATQVRLVEPSVETLLRIAARREPGGPVAPLYLRAADAKPQGASSLVRRVS